MDRKAMPQIRLRHFADPNYNPGRPKSSRATLFLHNAASPEEMHKKLPNNTHDQISCSP